MEKKNDKTILALKKQIAEKKAALSKAQSFSPKTNCSLLMDNGDRINLHVADVDTLTRCLIKLNALKMSADQLGLTYLTCGFAVEDWMDDIQTKLLILNRNKEEARLKVLEARLTELLSPEKKTELIITEIMNSL